MRVNGRRVLVTGAGGFAGPHLTRELMSAGARVIGLDRAAAPANLAPDDWHVADITDAAAVAAAVAAARPDAIVHLAGQSSAARSFEAPEETFKANVLGTWNVLEAVRECVPAARVLVVASGEVYGPQPEGSRVREDASFAPVSPYALSKAAGDALADAHARAYALDVVRVRAFGHAGPGQQPRFVVASFAQQIAAIERGGVDAELKVGNLAITRDLSDVRDIARAYRALLERGERGAAYNVCRGEGVRLDEVARRLTAMARIPIRITPDPARMRPADVPWLVGDPSAIAAATGWRAEIPLEQTLRDVLDEWRGPLTPGAASTRRSNPQG